jgi:hypothetical protein
MSIDLIWMLENELFTIHGQLDNFVELSPFIFERIKIYWCFQTKMFTMLLNSPNFVIVEMVIWNVTIDSIIRSPQNLTWLDFHCMAI